ncbi:putative membrane protein, partial [Candidatus Methanophagaceae archaeon]
MTTNTKAGFKTMQDIALVNILSALLIVVIAFFQDSLVRILIGLPFILLFTGYTLICALFPRKGDLDNFERLALSMGLSIAVTSLIGLALNYTAFGITLYSVAYSLFLFMLLMSAVAVYRRRTISHGNAFAPLSLMTISGCFERAKTDFIKSDEENRLFKIIAIVAFAFIISALTLIVKTPSANGYELSIYGAYPLYVWVFIICSIFMGQIILIRSALGKNDNFWIIGFLAIITTNTILLFIPFIRGYAIYGRGDVLTHIGYINDIFRTASIGTTNFYPLDHILAASLSYVTGISVERVVNIIPPLFSLFYILSIYLLAQQLFKRKGEVLFVLAFTSILLFGNGNFIFAPSVQSFFLLPFVLYLYFKSRTSRTPLEFGILLIISLFLIVFFHPMTTLFLILIFLILEFYLLTYKSIDKNQRIEPPKLQNRAAFNIILISFITFFTWSFSFAAITNSFRGVINWLRYEIGRTEAETYTELIARIQPDLFDLIQVIVNTYGQIIILGVLTLILTIYIYTIWRRHADEQQLNFYHVFFCIMSIIFGVLSIIFFFNDFIIGFGRVSKYSFFFASVFVALSFYFSLTRSKYSINKKRFIALSLCAVLILLVCLSTFNLYYSPLIRLPNQQVSEAELDGMTWFFDSRNEEMLIQELGITQKRFHDAIFGRTIPSKNVRYGKTTRP